MSNAVGLVLVCGRWGCLSWAEQLLGRSTQQQRHRRHLGFEAQSTALQVVGGGRGHVRHLDSIKCMQGDMAAMRVVDGREKCCVWVGWVWEDLAGGWGGLENRSDIGLFFRL